MRVLVVVVAREVAVVVDALLVVIISEVSVSCS